MKDVLLQEKGEKYLIELQLNMARKLIKEGNYNAAEYITYGVLLGFPMHFGALFTKARIKKFTGNLDESTAILERLEKLDTENTGIASLELGHVETERSRVALENDDKELGLSYLKKAIRQYAKCLGKDSEEPGKLEIARAYTKMGNIEWTRGEYNRAHTYYKLSSNVLDAYIGSPEAPLEQFLLTKGILQISMQSWPQARSVFEQMLKTPNVSEEYKKQAMFQLEKIAQDESVMQLPNRPGEKIEKGTNESRIEEIVPTDPMVEKLAKLKAKYPSVTSRKIV